MLEENLIRAREQGLKKARNEGRKEGEIKGARELLLRLLDRRFGPLSPAVRQQVGSITSSRRLAELAEQVLVSQSIEDMGLGAEAPS